MKNFIKNLRSFLLLPLSLLLFIVSLILSSLFYRKKIYSIHFCCKFFGHAAIEPAIASSFASSNNIKLFTSFQSFSHDHNSFLYSVLRSLFSDSFIPFSYLHYIYNNSFSFVQYFISFFYSPLLPNRIDREFFYLPYLSTELIFPWRTLARDKLNLPSGYSYPSSFPVLIACRTSHFHKSSSTVPEQDYRNLESDEIEYLLRSFLVNDDSTTFIIYTSHVIINYLLPRFQQYEPRLEFVDQQCQDVIPLFARSRMLVNNGNGIGAFATSLGFPTLFIKHSPYQSIHSSHLNAVLIPPMYHKSNTIPDLSESFELSFSPPCILPFDFTLNYSLEDISLLSLTKYPAHIFSDSLKQALGLSNLLSSQSLTGSFFNSFIHTDSNLLFWNIFNQLSSKQVKTWHSKQYMTISSSFLDYFSSCL